MKHFNKLLALLMLLSMALCLGSCFDMEEPREPEKIESWDEELLKSDPEDAEYEYAFDNVTDLLSAIKHEPDKYNNSKIKVVGTINKYYDSISLVDFVATSWTVPEKYESDYNLNVQLDSRDYISIIITNDAQYAVLEQADYVKVYGTVRLTRDAMYIDDCEYDLIASLDERRENFKQQ